MSLVTNFERFQTAKAQADVPAYLIADIFAQAADRDEGIGAGFRADIMAVLDRDPACERLIEPFLYFKGFLAIRTGSRIGSGPRAAPTSRSICRAGHPTYSRPISTRRRFSAKASSSITRPGSS
jgi:Serine acetyltransferase, N-terminal